MASADVDIELEDGEINDLEDGEIDEDILLSTESSNNVFSRLEPRQDLLRDDNNSYGVNNRDFVFHKSGPSPGRWEPQRGSFAPATRARFPREQKRGSPATLRGSRGKAFRGNGRGMMGREKSFLAKRGDSRRCILCLTSTHAKTLCFVEQRIKCVTGNLIPHSANILLRHLMNGTGRAVIQPTCTSVILVKFGALHETLMELKFVIYISKIVLTKVNECLQSNFYNPQPLIYKGLNAL